MGRFARRNALLCDIGVKMSERFTKRQKFLLDSMPLDMWLKPREEKFKEYDILDRTIMSLRKRGYIISSRLIGGDFEPYNYMLKRVK